MLCEVVDDYFLQQMVSEPTRRGNILDLIFTNTPEFLMNIIVCEKALEIRIISRSNLTGKLNLVVSNRLLGLFTTFAQQIGMVSGRISLRLNGIRSI